MRQNHASGEGTNASNLEFSKFAEQQIHQQQGLLSNRSVVQNIYSALEAFFNDSLALQSRYWAALSISGSTGDYSYAQLIVHFLTY